MVLISHTLLTASVRVNVATVYAKQGGTGGKVPMLDSATMLGGVGKDGSG